MSEVRVKSVPIRTFFWSAFSRIRSEYGDLRSIQENIDQEKLRIWRISRSGRSAAVTTSAPGYNYGRNSKLGIDLQFHEITLNCKSICRSVPLKFGNANCLSS